MENLTEEQKWKLIKDWEKRPLPEDSIRARWQRLNELARLGKKLGLYEDKSDKMIVYERWAKIKDEYERRLKDKA